MVFIQSLPLVVGFDKVMRNFISLSSPLGQDISGCGVCGGESFTSGHIGVFLSIESILEFI